MMEDAKKLDQDSLLAYSLSQEDEVPKVILI